MSNLVRPDFARGRAVRWRRPRARRRALSDTAALRLFTVAGGFALGIVALAYEWGIDLVAFVPDRHVETGIDVVDGDTVISGGHVYRLVGFNAPEAGRSANCGRERVLAAKATARLSALVADGESRLVRVACACPSGTEGTDACNYGRRCGRLTVGGTDVGRVLIGEGLAEGYHCSATACPPRKDWCAS